MNPMVVVCAPTTLAATDAINQAIRDRLREIEGPYEEIDCPYCQRPMLLSRNGREMLNSGRANDTICVLCLAEAAKEISKL